MKRHLAILVFLVLCLSLSTSLEIRAQSGGGYDLPWSIVSAGGTSAGGEFRLTGAVGQVGGGLMSGSGFALRGGILLPLENRIYLPLVLRN